MDAISASVDLSRAQFAISTTFHIVWPVLTIGLSILLVAPEGLWLVSGMSIEDGQFAGGIPS